MRVTQNAIATGTLNNLQLSLTKLQTLQQQMSSGRIIQKPADDPGGAVRAMQYRSDIKRNEQYGRNATDGLGWLGTADNTLTSSLSDIRKVRELMLQGMNATADPEARAALAAEVRTMKENLIGLANTTYNNRPIFAGTANPQGQLPPQDTYDAAGNYNGNTGEVIRTVGPSATVKVNLDGPSVWGTPGSGDLWHILDDIEAHLLSSNPNDTNLLASQDLARLDGARLNIQNRLSEIGARYHRVETMQQRAEDNLLTIRNGLSEIENIDIAETAVAIQLQQTAYQAALAATAKVIQPSLIDFLS